jgi:hypothetical protein
LARPIRPLAPRAGGSHLRGATALIAIAGLLIYTGSFAIGLGPVFWACRTSNATWLFPRPDERLPWLGAARRISASIRSGPVRRPASQAAAADSARRRRCDLRDNRQNYSCW